MQLGWDSIFLQLKVKVKIGIICKNYIAAIIATQYPKYQDFNLDTVEKSSWHFCRIIL